MIWIIISAVVFLISTFLTKNLVVVFKKSGILDIPNERSSHINPTPRGGGLAIIIGIISGLLLLVLSRNLLDISFEIPGIMFWIGFLLIAYTSFLDDKLNLPFYARFALHFFAANLVFYESNGLTIFPLPAPYAFEMGTVLNYLLTIFWILAVVNIYNFLDGIDGYAALQAIVAGLAMAILDVNGVGFTIGILTAAASFGFIIHNWRPAKIFMGDIGSAALGFLFATTPLYFTHIEKNVGVFSVGIFLWFFISDGAFTIIRRLSKGEKIWQAHRTHLYQQLVIAGLNHDKVSLIVMSSAFVLSGIFLFVYFTVPEFTVAILVLAFLFYSLYYFFVKTVNKGGAFKKQK